MNKNTLELRNNQNNIFTKKINTDYKLIPFNILVNDTGSTKYLPPVSKEWKNSVYNYNNNEIKNYPVYDININSLVKGYFSLYFNNRFLKSKYISPKSKRKSLNKIFVSKAEVKHTNNKAIITLYVYNRERLVLLKKIKKIKKIFQIGKINLLKNKLSKFIIKFLSRVLSLKKNKKSIKTSYIILLLKHKINYQLKYFNKRYFNINKRFIRRAKKVFTTIRRLRLKLSLNKYKFEEKFLYKLSGMISKYYGKKVEFNIVNLKSISYNSDIFTEILTLKIKKERSNPLKRMNLLLSKVSLPKFNTVLERSRVQKSVDYELVENKYKNLNLNSILGISDFTESIYNDNLSKLLYNLYYKTNTSVSSESVSSKSNEKLNLDYYNKLRNIIFENIKYKKIGGVRLEVKGRLTRRYRADRAIYKLKWKGGLKNIDSSFKGLSTVVLRGHLDPNIEKSVMASKRKIGSFAVKGWFAAK